MEHNTYSDITPEILRLAQLSQESGYIESELFTKYDVKRGLRDLNGKGVLAGLTHISDVRAKEIVNGEEVPAHGKLFYRGYNVQDLVDGFTKDNRFGFEECTYLLLFGNLPNEKELADFNAEIKAEYAAADPNATLVMASAGVSDAYVLDNDSMDKLITALNLMPNGVQAMCIDLPGLVETSLNMGVITLSEDNLQMCFSIRSSVSTAKAYIVNKVTQLTEFLGGKISTSGEYPAWPLARESKFREQCIEVYKNLYGTEPQVVTIHAGLECGILSEKIPGLDCISVGPNLKEIHTIKERASISSVSRVWNFIKAVLAYK